MSDVVGSASFELRATRDKIPADLEAARQEILAATKKTEEELSGVVGKGTADGNKKAAESFQAPKAAASDAGTAIKASMQAAGADIAAAVKSGTDKAKADLDSLAAKAREIQQVRLPQPTIPTDATHRLDTNPINGVQSWVPRDVGGGATPNISSPEIKRTTAEVKALTDSLDGVKPAASGVEAGLGGISKGALLTTASVGALIGVAVLVAKSLFEMGAAAMKSTSDLAGTAQRIGVSTDALQEWRFVAQKTGETAASADSALDSFGKKLAGAASQLNKEDVKAFRTLGFEPEQLKSFKTVEEALDVVTDRIKALANESDRAGIAEKLGLGALSTAFKDNATDIADLRDQAHSLGVVIDADVIRRGAEAQSQFETLSGVIDGQLKSAFVDLAPVILAAIGLVAQLATALGNALDAFRDLDNKTGRGLASQNQNLRDKVNFAYSQAPRQPGGQLTAVQQGWVRDLQASDAEIARRARESIDRSNPTDRTNPGGTQLVIPPERTPRGQSNPRGGVDRSEEREARRAERVEQEVFRARQRLLGIAEDDVLTAQQRFNLAQDQLKMDREARDAEIKSKTERGEIKDAERRTLEAVNAQADALENRILADNAFREIEDERLATERLMAGLASDLLSLQSGAARTAKERRQIELELLEIAQRQRREALQLELDRDPSKTPEQRAAAMAANGRIEGAETAAVNRNNMSPLEQWRDESLRTADEISEAYENVAARGLDSLNDGIVDAIMNSKSLGDVFSNVAKQILADLLKISIRRGITEPLANALFGGGEASGGGGGFASAIGSFLKNKIPGFATGVTDFGGGLARVHAGELLVNLPKGTDVITAGEARQLAGRGGAASGPAQVFDMRGAVVTEQLMRDVDAKVARGEARVKKEIPGAVNRGMATGRIGPPSWA